MIEELNQTDPNQGESIRRRSACLDFMTEVVRRGNGIHQWDAQVLTQLVSNLYRILPVHNTTPKEIGDKFEEDRYEYVRKIEAFAGDSSLDPDEYAFRVWAEGERFVERCTTFMNDTLFTTKKKNRKEATEGVGYESAR